MFSLRMKLNDVIGKDEQVILENIIPTPSKKACRFCEFNQTIHCNQGVR